MSSLNFADTIRSMCPHERRRVRKAQARMYRFAVVALLCTMIASSHACECAWGPLDDRTVRSASHVFVFQVEASKILEAERKPSVAPWAEAQLRVLSVFRGVDPPSRMNYSTFTCCGTRIDVGHYYVAFLHNPVSPFRGHYGNLLPLGPTYEPGYDDDRKIRQVVSGGVTLEEVFGEFPAQILAY